MSRDLARAIDFHGQVFGWEVVEDSSTEVLLGVPGVPGPRLRLVESPDAPAAEPPGIGDAGPRILGVRTRDVARSLERFAAVDTPGARKPPPAGATGFVGLGVDDVFYSVGYWEEPLFAAPALDADPQRLHSELHSVGVVVPDLRAACDFFVIGGGLVVQSYVEELDEGHPALAAAPGCDTLGTAILTDETWRSAVLELLQFDPAPSGAAETRRIGIRRVTYAVSRPSVEAVVADLIEAGAETLAPDVFGGPGGIEIEVRAVDGE